MNIIDLRTGVGALNRGTRQVTRTIEPDVTPILKLLVTEPIIQGLMDKLPKPNTIWSLDDRAKWLKAAAMIFNLVYRTDEQKPEQTTSAVLTPPGSRASHP